MSKAIRDSGAVPNLMRTALSEPLSVNDITTSKRITVSSIESDALKEVPVQFGSIRVSLDILVVNEMHYFSHDWLSGTHRYARKVKIRKTRGFAEPEKKTVILGLNYGIIGPPLISESPSDADCEEFESNIYSGTSGSDSDDEGLIAVYLK